MWGLAAIMAPCTSVARSAASLPLHTITTLSQMAPASFSRVLASSAVKVLMYLGCQVSV